MRRLEVLDGMRGYFLVFMLLNHLTFTGGYLLVKFNHAELGFVQDAQGFVFLSGLLAGMVYGKRMLKGGFPVGAIAVWRRTAEIYAYALGCILLILVLRGLLPDAGPAWEAWLGELGEGRVAHRLAAALLLYQPTFLDILPQYIAYMLVAPPLIWLCLSGRWVSVAVGSGLLWFAVQLGLHLPMADAINAALSDLGPDLVMRVPFNVLGWQVIFVSGLVIGALVAKGDLDTRRTFSPDQTIFLKFALALLGFFLLWRVGYSLEIVPREVMQRFRTYENRPEFGPIFLVNFAALGYAVAWLMIAGPNSSNALARRVGGLLDRLFRLRYLQLVGRHSLQIYAWHVIIVYLVLYLDHHAKPLGEASKTLIAITAIGLLSLPALWIERRRRLREAPLAGTA